MNDYPSPRYAWSVVGLLMTAYAFSFVDRQILNLLVGPIRRDLHLSDTEMSLLQGLAFALFYAVLGIPLGRLADRTSRRGLIAVGITLWSLMTGLCGVARNFTQLFLARIGVGIGEAALSPAAYSLMADYFPPNRLARAASVYYFGVHIGSALALVVGGIVLKALSHTETLSLPLLGSVHVWQVAFILVGIPGLLLAPFFAAIREPRDDKARRSSSAIPFPEAVLFLRARWRVYLPHFAGFSLISLAAYGAGAWAPSFFIRTFGWAAGDVGLVLGLMSLVCGTTGVYTGGWIADTLYQRGYLDGTLRTAMFGALFLTPCAILGPLMPTAGLALTFGIASTFLTALPFGVAAAAIQLVTPAPMRAQMIATYLFCGTLIGLGGGPTLIALITDHVFGREDALRYSMSIVGGVILPVAAFILFRGLKPFAAAVAQR